MSRRFIVLAALLIGAAAAPAAAPDALLVTPAWLSEHVHDVNLVILSTDDQGAFDKAHIPGARHVALSNLSTTRDGLDLEMLAPDELGQRLAALGIGDQTRVVITYGSVTSATRILMTLNHAGLGKNASLLDGGTTAWQKAGYPVTAETATVVPAMLAPLKIQPFVVDGAYVLAHLKAPHVRIVDARAPVFYDGSQAGMAKRAGHIPGAVNIPFTSVTDDQGRFRSVEELTALFTKAGVQADDTVIGYCHIGQQATAMLTAARLTGHAILLYDGSFQDWARHPDYPIVNPTGGGR